VGQLYLGGPNDKFSIFVKTNKWRSKLRVRKQEEFEKLVRDIGGKSLGEIMDAVFDGVLRTYAKRKRPFVRVELDGKTEREVGALLQLLMCEIMMLGKLMGVNPFDQPNVEEYKEEVRKLLAN
ncbi:hypothetical protein D6817_02380, partial [Candidatus Pacearchaeota archaeon]